MDTDGSSISFQEEDGMDLQPRRFSCQMVSECLSSSHASSSPPRVRVKSSNLDSHGAVNSMCLRTGRADSLTQKAVVCTLVMTRLWRCQLHRQMEKRDKTNSSKRPTRCSTLERELLKWR